MQAGIDDVLRRAPGARQVDATTIEMAPGFFVELPSAKTLGDTRTPLTVHPLYTCSLGYLCVWVDSRYRGTYAYFQVCGQEWDLGHTPFPGGGNWNDRISSISNNQYSPATSYFFNYSGSGTTWDQLLTMPAGTHRTNLALDSSDDGSGSPNDRIDGVHVCGSINYPWTPNHSGGLNGGS